GCFVQVEVSSGVFPVLRRPFTVSDCRMNENDRRTLLIIFEVKGRGTRLLAGTSAGQELRVLGPLGKGYSKRPGEWLLVGGGMGAAGFPWLARSVDGCTVLLGASSENRLIRLPDFKCLEATEDGSAGEKGLVTSLLEGMDISSFSTVAVCGPVAMMRAVMNSLPRESRDIVQVSTEARMGCGWGVCEGCSIPAADGGYLKCCTDGPVMSASLIDWERWKGI
ncbi:MAG: dihydroorotate dehydrogenase electron transfer subunit, partial [Candidatus Aegiribacteria sp.]|nr:dihydroorotate dehydrogenase electron transfer subunit [Candidatus Aegiribacteria sp.]MBD3295355.1 dihydroorotate dehydrogenase electron transfer subunit [Candidatus Fermentibacteria bacterium]